MRKQTRRVWLVTQGNRLRGAFSRALFATEAMLSVRDIQHVTLRTADGVGTFILHDTASVARELDVHAIMHVRVDHGKHSETYLVEQLNLNEWD